MADDGKTPSGSTVDLDAEGKQLQLGAEKAQYLEAIAKSQQGVAEAKAASLKSVLPTVTDAPKGEVTLGDKAGAFGPWRAHQIIDAVAQQVAIEVKEKLGGQEPRVLVVDDRSLVEGDWTARRVRDTLDRLRRRIRALEKQVLAGQKTLEDGIRAYTADEAVLVGAAPEDGGGRRSITAPTPTAGTPAVGAAPVGAPGALGAAVDLLGLIRTDYTLTASTVTPGPAEIVTLTAVHLAAAGLSVEGDVFSTMRASPSAEKFNTLLDTRDAVVESLSVLTQLLAPVEAELAAIGARVAIVEQQWATAAADAKGDLTPVALRQAGDALAQQASRREQVVGPARTLVIYAQQVVADVDAAVTALLQAPEGGQAPLFTAARRERLERGDDVQDAITHVLHVTLDAVASDTVTRRSILGASGVLRFLTAGNASWTLLDTATGTIVGGAQQSPADVMTLSLSTGEATYQDTPALDKARSAVQDPTRGLESAARVLVVILAVVLAILGVLSVAAVIRAVSW